MSGQITNATTAQAATFQNLLPLDQVQLIGIFTETDTGRVLIRTADGETLLVGANDNTPIGRLVAIGQDFALFDRGGAEHLRLALPS